VLQGGVVSKFGSLLEEGACLLLEVANPFVLVSAVSEQTRQPLPLLSGQLLKRALRIANKLVHFLL
jgi:hypothetical protein